MGYKAKLFLSFGKIGLVSFGGGLGMIPLIAREVVEKHKWISDEDMLEIIAISESTPGPIAINTATFVGNRVAGFWGAVVATIGVVLPAFVIMFVISYFVDAFLQNEYIGHAFYGVRACVGVLILNAFLKLFKKREQNVISYVVFFIVFALALFTEISTILLVLASACVALAWFFILKRRHSDDLS